MNVLRRIFLNSRKESWHPPVKIDRVGAKKFRLALLSNSHPPDQNSETAPDLHNRGFVIFHFYFVFRLKIDL